MEGLGGKVLAGPFNPLKPVKAFGGQVKAPVAFPSIIRTAALKEAQGETTTPGLSEFIAVYSGRPTEAGINPGPYGSSSRYPRVAPSPVAFTGGGVFHFRRQK